MLLFGGFLLKNGDAPYYLNWMRYLSWFMYGNEALSINQWHGGINSKAIISAWIIITSLHHIPLQLNSIIQNVNFVITRFLHRKRDVHIHHFLTIFWQGTKRRLPATETIFSIRSTLIRYTNYIFHLHFIQFDYIFGLVLKDFFVRDICCLAVSIIGFHAMAFMALLRKTYRK